MTPDEAQKIRSRQIAAYAKAAERANGKRLIEPLARRIALRMIRKEKALKAVKQEFSL